MKDSGYVCSQINTYSTKMKAYYIVYFPIKLYTDDRLHSEVYSFQFKAFSKTQSVMKSYSDVHSQINTCLRARCKLKVYSGVYSRIKVFSNA